MCHSIFSWLASNVTGEKWEAVDKKDFFVEFYIFWNQFLNFLILVRHNHQSRCWNSFLFTATLNKLVAFNGFVSNFSKRSKRAKEEGGYRRRKRCVYAVRQPASIAIKCLKIWKCYSIRKYYVRWAEAFRKIITILQVMVVVVVVVCVWYWLKAK